MTACRICGTPIEAFMSLGRQPIANGFRRPDDESEEYFFELAPALCSGCGMVQLVDQPEPERMFHGEYAFFSGTSNLMKQHFQAYAEDIRTRLLAGREDPFVVELGSNDGVMLRHFASAGVRHLGVEPSSNVAAAAREVGVDTLVAFFSAETARGIAADRGKADAILAANVMCHIPDLNSVAEGVTELLSDDGFLVFEDPYLGSMLEKTSYDQLYDEHVYIFSASSVAAAFGRHGLELVDAKPITTHGGGMRYFLARKGAHQPSPAVKAILADEDAKGFTKPETFAAFRARCEKNRDDFKALLQKFKAEGARVVGYGATSKSTTVLNYAGIGPDLIEFISDTTPIKQGKLTPGMRIPVKSYDAFTADYPDYAILFAWNHATEIMAKEEAFNAAGGKWIHFVPTVRVES